MEVTTQMRSIRRLTLTALAALAAMAVAAPAASAGWQIQTTGGAPYTGPLNMSLSVGTADWFDPSNGFTSPCSASSLSGSITNAGPATPAASIASASWSGCPLGTWVGKDVPWSATVQTDTVAKPKLSISAPELFQTYWCAPPTNGPGLAAPTLDGRLSNVSGHLQWQVFNNAGAGYNSIFTVQFPPNCSLSIYQQGLRAFYRLRGDSGGTPIDLKIVQVP